MLQRTIVRLRALLRRSATDRELDEELRLHIERAVQRNIARGMSEPMARDAARREFGNSRRSPRKPAPTRSASEWHSAHHGAAS